jgi:outer membrane biosynthesis protein TonB
MTFPKKCKMSQYEGAFIFEATITETGDVSEVQTTLRPKLTPPCPELEEACRHAISSWKYEPAKRDGKPVSVYLTISVLPHPW